MEITFLISLSFVIYTYFGYPLILYIWAFIYSRGIKKGDFQIPPFVTVIIAARNEEKYIERRIKNLVDQNYPKGKFEITVVSDGSNDKTNNIVEKLSRDLNEQNVGSENFLSLLSYNSSRGKPYALNMGIKNAKGEIVVFTDSRQQFRKDAISQLVANFKDANVGCVSGELMFVKALDSTIEGEMSVYWNFEKHIRKLESKTGSVPGATGAIYAIRKDLFRPLPEQTLLDDVMVPLNICMQGYRVVFDSKAKAFDIVSADIDEEKRRKIRTLAGNWQLLTLEPNLFNPMRNPIWFKFISHKIFRLLIPYFIITLVVAALLCKDFFSVLVLILFTLFGLAAIIPPVKTPFGMISKITRISRAIIYLNYFALIAPMQLIMSSRKLW